MPRPCFTDEQLIAYAAGEITGADAAKIERHLATDPAAAHVVGLYRLAAETRAADDSVAPPRETVEQAKHIADRTRAVISNWPERVVAKVARLAFDSRLQPIAVRVEHGEDQFQLSFSTDRGEIDLQAQRLETKGNGTAPKWQLIGQYTGDDGLQDMDVAMFRSGHAQPVAVARADERSVFTMEIDPGEYEMRLTHADAQIVIPGLDIK